MHNGVVPATANAGPAKRMRRPSVRLHQPYYENPGHRKLQREWKAMLKDAAPEGVAKKARTGKVAAPPAGGKRKKKNGGSESSKGDMEGLLNYEEELAIGNWKSFNAANRERDFKRKRVRPSSTKKWSSAKTLGSEGVEIERLPMSSGGESKANGEGKEGEGEENLGVNGIHSNLGVENSEPSSPNCSFRNEDNRDDDKLSEDDNAVGLNNKGMEQRGVRNNSRDSNEVRGNDGMIRDGGSDDGRNGVRIWLNQLGLAKYEPLFKVHEVDDAVLPFLTLEDLKDMGVNAVGSRRKMYASIEKLGKGFH